METSKKWIAVAALVLASAAPAAAQEQVEEEFENIGYGTRAAEFLLLPVGARATALGQAATAVADDAAALYWNPAGIGLATQSNVTISQLDYVAGTSYSWAGAVFPTADGTWVFGAQAGGFRFGEAPVYTVENPEGNGSVYSNSMFVGGLTAAMNVTDLFTFGITGKYIQENFANTSGSTFGVDIGTNYHTTLGGRPIRAAFSLMNLGGSIKPSGAQLVTDVDVEDPTMPDRRDAAELRTQDFSLPVMFKVGVAYEAYSTATNQLLIAGEFWQPQHTNTSAAAGVEYMLRPSGIEGFSLALRGGYTYEPDRNFEGETGVSYSDESSDGLTFGGGVGYQVGEDGFALKLDYAYRQMGLLGNSNLFSVSVGW